MLRLYCDLYENRSECCLKYYSFRRTKLSGCEVTIHSLHLYSHLLASPAYRTSPTTNGADAAAALPAPLLQSSISYIKGTTQNVTQRTLALQRYRQNASCTTAPSWPSHSLELKNTSPSNVRWTTLDNRFGLQLLHCPTSLISNLTAVNVITL